MRRLFLLLFVFLFSLNIYTDSNNNNFLTRKYQGIAIGQLTLAHRLISLSTSLAISKAVDEAYIISLLQNIDSTIENSKNIIQTNGNTPDQLTKDILTAIDFFIGCSNSVKLYTKNPSYNNLSSVRNCVENSSDIINSLTDAFNSKKLEDNSKKQEIKPAGKSLQTKPD